MRSGWVEGLGLPALKSQLSRLGDHWQADTGGQTRTGGTMGEQSHQQLPVDRGGSPTREVGRA